MGEHRDYWVTERKSYYYRRKNAKDDPNTPKKTLVLIIDSMDQNNNAIPNIFAENEDLQRFPARITGVIAHGLPNPFFAFINTRWLGDSNANIYCLLYVLSKVSYVNFLLPL